MSSLLIVNALVAVVCLQLVSSVAFPPPRGGGAREIPRPPAKPAGQDQHHVTWAPGDRKLFTGHDEHSGEHNETDHSGEEHGKGVTFVPPRGDHPGPLSRHLHKRDVRQNGQRPPKDGQRPPRDAVTFAPHKRGTEQSIDNSAEGVTRNPLNKHDHTESSSEKRGDGVQPRHLHKRDVRQNGQRPPKDGQRPPRDAVTFAPHKRGTEQSIDNSAEGVTRNPLNKHDHLFTEAGKARRDGPRNH